MNDLLPDASALWEVFEARAHMVLRAYGYARIRTPVVESTPLFVRGIGTVTDIVEKEMYSFTDSLNGEPLALRPENTAGIIRAAIEHNLVHAGPQRLWNIGPMFRHERPQRGRYREFFQLDVEALGWLGPDIDAEQILMLRRLWEALEIGPVRLEINSLGAADERARHRQALIAFLEKYQDGLDEDGRRRLHTNPLRVLDSKNPQVQEIVAQAPRLLDFLGAASRAHFEGLQGLLSDHGVAFTVNPRLVRGLDYYNLTVFEWITDQLGAQGTVCGGGRYDPLFETLGGKPTPACGFAMGIERVVELMRAAGAAARHECDVYVLHQGGETFSAALRAAELLRNAGLDVVLHAGDTSMKAQMRRADASGAEFAVIVGSEEMAQSAAAVKALRAVDEGAPFARQRTIGLDALADTLVQALCEEGLQAEDGPA